MANQAQPETGTNARNLGRAEAETHLVDAAAEPAAGTRNTEHGTEAAGTTAAAAATAKPRAREVAEKAEALITKAKRVEGGGANAHGTAAAYEAAFPSAVMEAKAVEAAAKIEAVAKMPKQTTREAVRKRRTSLCSTASHVEDSGIDCAQLRMAQGPMKAAYPTAPRQRKRKEATSLVDTVQRYCGRRIDLRVVQAATMCFLVILSYLRCADDAAKKVSHGSEEMDTLEERVYTKAWRATRIFQVCSRWATLSKSWAIPRKPGRKLWKSCEVPFRGHTSATNVRPVHREVTSDIIASGAYDTERLWVLEQESICKTWRAKVDDHVDVCYQVPPDTFKEEDNPDISMFGTTSLVSLAELVATVPLDAIVKVVHDCKERNVGHRVVVGPDRFQLCTCLQTLRCGYPCRHILAALVTELSCVEEFDGNCLHPRWRSTVGQWSIELAQLSTYDGYDRGTCDGGFTGDDDEVGNEAVNGNAADLAAVSVVRGRVAAAANIMEAASRLSKRITANLSERLTPDVVNAMFADMERMVDVLIAGPTVVDPLAGLGNPPCPISKCRQQKRHLDCTEGRRGKKKQRSFSTANDAHDVGDLSVHDAGV